MYDDTLQKSSCTYVFTEYNITFYFFADSFQYMSLLRRRDSLANNHHLLRAKLIDKSIKVADIPACAFLQKLEGIFLRKWLSKGV